MIKNKLLLGLLAVIGVVLLLSVSYYNGFVGKKNAIDGQWQQVEVQYQRRFDLIPNLVESVKGAQGQEQEVFGQLAEARSRYAGAATVDEKAAAAGQLESALSRLLVVVENYPELKSNETVLRLMDELSGTENRVSVERRRYNELVQDYNTSIQRFPGVVFARMMGFGAPRTYFESAEGSEAAPKVDFSN